MPQRYDFLTFNPVRKTDEGFIHDTPIVGRVGIQQYLNSDGSIRRELRLPEDVFKADSLASFAGKPITVDHPAGGAVTHKTAGAVMIGTMLSAGKQDGDSIRADIVLHVPDAIGDRRQLSLGYKVDLDETPGEWNGQKYDAIQRNIVVNHLSVVKSGRAGVARLNIDGNEEPFNETKTMPKIKLDNGIEYEAAPEVIAALDGVRGDNARLKLTVDAHAPAVARLEAERDGLKAKLDAMPAELAKAAAQGRIDAAARIELEKVATGFKVDCKGKTDREVKEAVIKTARKDADLTGKSDDYVNAAFDFAHTSTVNTDAAMAAQRQAAAGGNPAVKNDAVSAKSAYETYMDNMGKDPVAAK